MDNCVDSNDESVTLYTYNPITSQTDELWMGSGANGGELCYTLPFANSIQGQLFIKAVEYLADNVQKMSNAQREQAEQMAD